MALFRTAFNDGDRLEVAGVGVRLRVNRRARRVSLRLDRTKREIVATAPSARRLSEAVAFARERARWIAEKVAELPQAEPLRPGMTVQVFGQAVALEAGQGRARWHDATADQPARITAHFTHGEGEGEGYARAVMLLLRRRALAVLTERTAHYAAALGAPMPKVAVADPKGRWGSCKVDRKGEGFVRYNWRLALAPWDVADYVAAHECAHLLEQNHGPRFWAHVHDLVGDHRPHREWLKDQGAALHAFGT